MNEKIKTLNPDVALKSVQFINYLIKPQHTKTYSLFTKKAFEIENSLMTKIFFPSKGKFEDLTDEEILIRAFGITRDILFDSVKSKCKFSVCLYTTFVSNPEEYINYTTRFKDKIKIVFDIRTLKGLENQLRILSLKNMEPVLTFLNAYYNAELFFLNQDETLDNELIYQLIDCYLDYIFETYEKCKDISRINPEICINRMLEIIKNYKIT